MSNVRTAAVNSYHSMPPQFPMVGEWTGDTVTVECDELKWTLKVQHNYPGRCLCWVVNHPDTHIPTITEAIKLKANEHNQPERRQQPAAVQTN